MISSERKRRFTELIKEASEYGFRLDLNPPDDGQEGRVIRSTYICAKSGKECVLYFMPREISFKENLTDGKGGYIYDGKGGYIYYDGVWAKNTSEWFKNEQIIKKRKEQIGKLL